MLPITIPEEPNNEFFYVITFKNIIGRKVKEYCGMIYIPKFIIIQVKELFYVDVLRKLPEPFNTINKNLINLVSNSKIIKMK